MRRIFVVPGVLALMCAVWANPAWGEARHHQENRFLFVVETSSAMEARTNGIQEATVGLLNRQIKGELRPKDTIGLWTYNDRLHTDFPMQMWLPKKTDEIAGKVAEFLRRARFEKRGKLQVVYPALRQVVAGSERLTIVLVTDGTEPLKGTPFDDDINDLQKRYAKEFRKRHLPMVIVLAASDGQVFDYTMNYPDAINVPHTADPLPPPVTNAPVASAPPPMQAPKPEPPPRHIEIIMSGRTNMTIEPTTATPVTAPTPAPVVAPMTTPPPTQGVAPMPAPLPAAAAPPSSVVTPAPTPVLAASTAAPTQAGGVVSTEQPTPVVTPLPVAPRVGSAPSPATASVAPRELKASSTAVAPPKPAIQAPTAGPANPVPVRPVAPSAPTLTFQQVELFVIAISLLTIAVVLVIFLVRRARHEHRPSLISQSMNQPR